MVGYTTYLIAYAVYFLSGKSDRYRHAKSENIMYHQIACRAIYLEQGKLKLELKQHC